MALLLINHNQLHSLIQQDCFSFLCSPLLIWTAKLKMIGIKMSKKAQNLYLVRLVSQNLGNLESQLFFLQFCDYWFCSTFVIFSWFNWDAFLFNVKLILSHHQLTNHWTEQRTCTLLDYHILIRFFVTFFLTKLIIISQLMFIIINVMS